MPIIALYRSFASLDRLDRRLVLEAASLMAVVWAGLRLLRLPTLLRFLDRYAARPRKGARTHDSNTLSKVRWAVAAVTARFPSATCLVQALAADALLRRRGLSPELRIGVRARGNSMVPIEAHAWVECSGSVAVGSIDNLSDFTVLVRALGSP